MKNNQDLLLEGLFGKRALKVKNVKGLTMLTITSDTGNELSIIVETDKLLQMLVQCIEGMKEVV